MDSISPFRSTNRIDTTTKAIQQAEIPMKTKTLTRTIPSFAALGVLLALPETTQAAITLAVDRDAVDRIVGRIQSSGSPDLGYYEDSGNNFVGATGGNPNRHDNNVLYRYTLPTLPLGTTSADIESFTFSYQVQAHRNHSGDGYGIDVYMLDVADPRGTGTDFFYHGPDDSDHALVGSYLFNTQGNNDNFTFSPPTDVSFTVTSGASLDLLRSFYGGAGFDDHEPNRDVITFRFNLDDLYVNPTGNPISGTALNRYQLENNPVDVNNDPIDTFTMNVIPEPTTALLGGLGILVLLRRRR